jgi:putative YphP/YqiW family bacilliredoxin
MFKINTAPIYDPAAVQPMRDELLAVGFKEMLTPDEVKKHLTTGIAKDETVLVFINSVCGCAAGSARPGVMLALQNKTIPDKMVTVFAGQDREAVEFLRKEYFQGTAPSSPFMALFKNSKIIHLMQRFNIEGRTAEDIASELIQVFNAECKNEGPSVPHEHFEKIVQAKMCGSKIPLYRSNM